MYLDMLVYSNVKKKKMIPAEKVSLLAGKA